jgi:hypothetical protein
VGCPPAAPATSTAASAAGAGRLPAAPAYQPPSQQPDYGTQPPPPTGQQYAAPAGQAIPNYLVFSILSTLLCCLPAGVVGIVYSSQVNTKLSQGDYAGAKSASDNARLWSIISAGAGVLWWIFIFIVIIAQESTTPTY